MSLVLFEDLPQITEEDIHFVVVEEEDLEKVDIIEVQEEDLDKETKGIILVKEAKGIILPLVAKSVVVTIIHHLIVGLEWILLINHLNLLLHLRLLLLLMCHHQGLILL